MTASPLVRLLSIMDPAFRYAEHRRVRGLLRRRGLLLPGHRLHRRGRAAASKPSCSEYLGCAEVETRVVSGQMANMAVFSALVDYLNRADRKAEPRRIGMVMNNHIGKGGHLSAQPMGALRDFVARDPRTDAPGGRQLPGAATTTPTRSTWRRSSS